MIKTMTFAAVHFTVAFSVGYAMTGSVLVGGAIALVEPAINTVAFYLHEQVWNRVQKVKHAAPVENFVQPM
jgi:uncharacterized membrane protein